MFGRGESKRSQKQVAKKIGRKIEMSKRRRVCSDSFPGRTIITCIHRYCASRSRYSEVLRACVTPLMRVFWGTSMTVSRKNSRISQKQKCEKGLHSGPYLQSIHKWTCAIISRIYFELCSGAMMGCEVASESDRISKCSVIVLHVHTETCGALQSLAFSINHFMPEFEVCLN